MKYRCNLEATQMQFRCNLDATQMQFGCKLNVIQIQFRCSLDAIQMQLRCNLDAIQVQNRCNLDAIQMQLNPHSAVILKSLILRRGGQLAHWRKYVLRAISLHTKNQKTYKGTLGTQDLTSIGSRTSHGPSKDPTGPQKQT